MPADALVLLRPKNPTLLEPYLDIDDDEGDDDDSDESDLPYAERLADGAFLVHTFQPFAVFQGDPDEGRVWLEAFAEVLDGAHDDPRGVFFFPDEPAIEADTYDEIVAEVEAARRGLWIPKALLTAAERAARNATLSRDLEEAKRMVAALTGTEMTHEDAERAVAMAKKLSSGAPALATPFGAAKLLEDVQKQLMGAMGLAARPSEDTVVVLVKRKTELEVDEDEVVDAYLLEDGSVALETFVPLASRDDLAAELRGPRAAWIAEHEDPRGVPTFSSAHLESLEDVGQYEAVLEALGDEVTFVRVR